MAGNGADATATPRGTEAVVQFTTRLGPDYHVPEDDLVVPSSLARYGLSEVINKLLDRDPPVPFDFLVNDTFLRTSVADYLESHKLSSEKVLKLEYVLALSEPETKQVDKSPDWIASVTALGTLPTPWFAAVGYDGTVRVFEENTSRFQTQLSDCPLTAVTALPTGSGKSAGSLLLAASKDGAARCCALRRSSNSACLGPAAALRASTEAALSCATEAVAFNEDGTLLATAGWDHEVRIWNADPALFVEPTDEDVVGQKRKAVVDAGDGRTPKFSLPGHTQVVSALHFGAKERFPYTLLSGSWDCSVRVWDIAAGSCVCNWTVARAVTSLTASPDAPPQIATSHEDGHVSLWDVRAPPHPTVNGAVSLDQTAGLPLSSAQVPHTRMASQVAWCPMDSTRLASVGHDGMLCILDPRSPKMPLQSLKLGAKGPIPTKLLCVCWLGRDALVVGGSDGKVVRITI
jgi:ribosome biogenesis protein YTM1